MERDYGKFWGKADKDGNWHPLVCHMLDVAAVAQVWLEKNPDFLKKAAQASGLTEKSFLAWFLFFLALHDIGKFSITFQNLKPELLYKLQGKKNDAQYIKRHDQLGNQYYESFLLNNLQEKFFNDIKSPIISQYFSFFASLSFGHHGVPVTAEPIKKLPAALELYFEDLIDLFIDETTIQETVTLLKGSKAERKQKISGFAYFTWQLAGLTVLCDWIASGSYRFDYQKKINSLPDYYEQSLQKAKDAISDADILPAKLNSKSGMEHLFPNFSDSPTPLQKYCNEVDISLGPQLWILEDVTGAGKTEAALTLASRLLVAGNGTGVFISLPTMATSNAMYERMAEVYRKLYDDSTSPSLILSHGSRHLSEKFRDSYRSSFLSSLPDNEILENEDIYEGRAHCSQWLSDSSKKSLLADVGVGTIDQVLMAGLPVRYQSLRAFGMSQKVLIFDEVHAFDAYMLRLLENIIKTQAAFGGSTILLSATLPFKTREKFCSAYLDGIKGIDRDNSLPKNRHDFPLITGLTINSPIIEDKLETRKSVDREVAVELYEDVDTVYGLIIKSVANGECICWIRNTIADVRDSYSALQEKGIDKLDMFHSRYALYDRLKIEQRVLKRFGKHSTPNERA